MFFSKFFPKKVVRSTYSINFKKYYKNGYKGVLFDIDNTLVPHGEAADDKAVKFFQKLRDIGFKFCLISNNKEERVRTFAEKVGAPYIYDAHKPSTEGYNKAMEIIGTDVNETIFVGDQVFTDVFGGNRASLYTILVRPIHHKEEIQIVLKRYIEKPILFFYKMRDRKKLKKENKQYNKRRLKLLAIKRKRKEKNPEVNNEIEDNKNGAN